MKKYLAAASSAVLIAGLIAAPASAAGGVYAFEEYGFSCQVPDALYVFTQDMDPDDPLFEKFDISYEDEMSYLTANGSNTIMNMNDALVSFELDLDAYKDSSFDDFSTYSQEDLDSLAESYANVTYTGEDVEVEEVYTATYQEVPYIFVQYALTQEDTTYHIVNCQTVVNGINYVYHVYSYTEAVSDAQMGYLESILNSSVFSTPGEPIEALPTETPAADETPAGDITSGATGSDSSVNLISSIVGGLVAGLLMGLIPLIVGLKKGQKTLAWVGFGVCVVCGGVLGLLLALPVAIIFLIVILVRGKKPKDGQPGGPQGGYGQPGYGQPTAPTGQEPWNRPPQGGYGQPGYDQPTAPTGQEPWNQPPQGGNNAAPKDDPWDK